MTSKNGGKRPPVPLDQYFTPPWIIEQAMELVLPVVLHDRLMRPDFPVRILEPSAGQGAFIPPLKKIWPAGGIWANDVDATLGDWAHLGKDPAPVYSHLSLAELAEKTPRGFFDLAIGNPPYSEAQEHCSICWVLARYSIMLVRQGFMSSATRASWFRKKPPSHIFILANRPRFDVPAAYLEEFPEDEYGKWGTDSADYCWMCWSRDWEGPTQLVWLPPVPKDKR